MEDVAVTIFRVVIIALLILGAVKRDKRKRTTGKGTDGSGNRPAIPWEQPRQSESSAPAPAANRVPTQASIPVPAAEPQRRTHGQDIRKSVVPASQRVEYVEVDPEEAEAMAAEYYKKRSTYSPVAGAEKPAVKDRPEHADDREGDGSDIAGRFNIRDAVLYSEILRPKFEE